MQTNTPQKWSIYKNRRWQGDVRPLPYGLSGDVPLDTVWFFYLFVSKQAQVCPKQGIVRTIDLIFDRRRNSLSF